VKIFFSTFGFLFDGGLLKGQFRRVSFLGVLVQFLFLQQQASALQVSPSLPVLYEGWNNGQVEVVVDLTPEEKAQLTGSGVISVAVTSISLEVVGGALISIPYKGQETFPQSTAVLRKKAKFPERDEEYHWGEYGFSATPVTAPQYMDATFCAVSVVGSHYECVKRYLTRAQIEFQSAAAGYNQAYIAANQFKSHFTDELLYPESRRYSIFANLVNNIVPEQHFRKWLPYIYANPGLDGSLIGASYALSVEPGYLLPLSDPNGLGGYGFTVNFDFLERGVDRSGRSEALRDEYLSKLGVLPNFSIENRVPLSFFEQELSKLPADLNVGLKDYTIAGFYNKEVRVRERVAQIGMDADSLYQGLFADYGVDDYEMIPPGVAEVIARTYTDPQYRISRPLALVVSDKDVSDGTFSDDRILAHLAKTHRVVYGQALDAAQFKAIAAKGYQKHGAFDLVVSAGHGNSAASGAIGIGSDDVFEQLALLLNPQATVMLASCSSGDRRGVDDTLADKMRRFLPGRRVIAADFPTSGEFLYYDAAASAENRYHVYNKGAATVGAFDLKISPPGDVVVPASDLNGTVVHYPAASVAALNGGSLSVQYSKASGSLFPPGVTVVVVNATDGLGHTATTSFNVTVQAGLPKSQNCNLVDIILSYGALHDGFFDRDKTGYSVTVPFAVKNLRLTPLADDPTAGVLVNSVALAPGEGRLLPLNEGDNAIDVRVMAQSGANKTYRLIVKRGAPPIGSEASADLAWLGVSSSQLPQEKKNALGYDALAPGFAGSKLDYACSVPPLATAVRVTPLLANSSARVAVNGALLSAESALVQLAPGQNVVTVAVTSADGRNTKTYRLRVNRTTWNTNANLSSFQFEEGLSPFFSKDRTSYSVSVIEGWPRVRISALAPEDSNARVTFNGFPITPLTALEVGEYDLVVTAQDGVTVKTYTVNVMPAASENADLAGLAVTGGTLSNGFSAGVTGYTLSVPYTTTSLSVTPVAAVSTAGVKVKGTPVASGSASASSALAVGTTVIPVVVTAPNGTSVKSYTITVTRAAASTNANLANLTVNGGILSPGFANGVTAYTLSVPYTITSLSVTPVMADSTAGVKVNGTPVASGSASASVALAVGSNVIPVVVTAQDGVTKKTYSLTVSRSVGSLAALSRMELRSASLSPAFSTGTTGYGATVLNYVNAITVDATAASENAIIKVNGVVGSGSLSTSVPLVEGSNAMNVTVTPENGGVEKSYEVVVLRQPAFDGGYDGMVLPASEAPNPSQALGVSSVTVNTGGRFSGNVRLGGKDVSVPFSGYFDVSGVAQFAVGSVRTTSKDIVRTGLPTLALSMRVDFQPGLTHQVVGELRSGSLVAGTFTLNRRLYSRTPAPAAPMRNVPVTVLDPAKDNGKYTFILPAVDPAVQKMAASTYPQGSGWATAVVSASGLVAVSGELADGQRFAFSQYLSKDNRLPFYIAAYRGTGAFGGEVSFRDVPGQSDADGVGLRWFKPPLAADALYPSGWPSGIRVDLLGSKFLGATVTKNTVLDTVPAVYPAVNALLSLRYGGLPSMLSNNLTVGRTLVSVQGAPAGGAAALNGLVTLGSTGQITGRFARPDAAGSSVQMRGVVFQKTHHGAGYFIAPSAGGRKPESGLLELAY